MTANNLQLVGQKKTAEEVQEGKCVSLKLQNFSANAKVV